MIAQRREHHHLSWRARFAEAPPAPEDPTPLEAMVHLLATPEGRQLHALRKQTPEPVFGIIKSVMGFRQFHLRGLDKVKGEWNLGHPGLEREADVRPANRLNVAVLPLPPTARPSYRGEGRLRTVAPEYSRRLFPFASIAHVEIWAGREAPVSSSPRPASAVGISPTAASRGVAKYHRDESHAQAAGRLLQDQRLGDWPILQGVNEFTLGQRLVN